MPSKTHTPGPWYRGELPCSGDAHGNPPTVYIWDEGETNFIATVCDEDNNGHATDANANLIAAAPELLSALKGFVKKYDHAEAYGDQGLLSLLRTAEESIRKAEGRPEPSSKLTESPTA